MRISKGRLLPFSWGARLNGLGWAPFINLKNKNEKCLEGL